MIYLCKNQIKNRKIWKRFKSKSKSWKKDSNRDLNHFWFRFESYQLRCVANGYSVESFSIVYLYLMFTHEYKNKLCNHGCLRSWSWLHHNMEGEESSTNPKKRRSRELMGFSLSYCSKPVKLEYLFSFCFIIFILTFPLPILFQ